MKKILTIAFATLLISNSAFAADYGWSISGSSTDPEINSGSIAPGAPQNTYLWLNCSPVDGISAVEADVVVNGMLFLSFVPLNGVLNAGSASALLLAVGGCPTAPFLAGSISVLNFGSGGDVCLVDSAANGLNASVNCDVVNPQLFDNAIAGFSTAGAGCMTLDCTTSVESTSWSDVKGLYR